ncbi:MAG: MBOAT family protein [Lachnospiraceae bacterium]|nr:MBOAT family protein [Lachnospiraceae bacterium]
MLFNSYIFILLFLPLALAGYFLINRKSFAGGKVWLVAMSLWFYAYYNPLYLMILIASVVFNYGAGKMISGLAQHRKLALALGIAVNLAALFYFKYYDFFVENINYLFKTGFTLRHLILPLAISFFTFKQIAYLVDSYRGEVPVGRFLDYTLFVVFFPQLIMGPILLPGELIPQFLDEAKKKINYENLAKGMMAFAFGLAKKVLLADTFAVAVDWGYAHIIWLNTTDALLLMLFFTLQIYFDFSGYCDMATGLGLMFNIDIAQNFNSPYRALSVADFWQRWHITLTRFFRKYLYIPLGGNRKGKARTYLHYFLVFLVSGLWHGANYTFIVWGAAHGLFFCLAKLCQKQIDRIPALINWLFTFLFVNFTWVLFRAESLGQSGQLFGKMADLKFGTVSKGLSEAFYLPETVFVNKIFTPVIVSDFQVFLWPLTLFAVYAAVFMRNTNERIAVFAPKALGICTTVILSVWGILSLSGVETYIYMGF